MPLLTFAKLQVLQKGFILLINTNTSNSSVTGRGGGREICSVATRRKGNDNE